MNSRKFVNRGLTDEDLAKLSLRGIKHLLLQHNRLKTLTDVHFSHSTEKIWLTENFITTLEYAKLPDRLHTLILTENLLSSIANIQFPIGLKYLNLSGNRIN